MSRPLVFVVSPPLYCASRNSPGSECGMSLGRRSTPREGAACLLGTLVIRALAGRPRQVQPADGQCSSRHEWHQDGVKTGVGKIDGLGRTRIWVCPMSFLHRYP